MLPVANGWDMEGDIKMSTCRHSELRIYILIKRYAPSLSLDVRCLGRPRLSHLSSMNRPLSGNAARSPAEVRNTRCFWRRWQGKFSISNQKEVKCNGRVLQHIRASAAVSSLSHARPRARSSRQIGSFWLYICHCGGESRSCSSVISTPKPDRSSQLRLRAGTSVTLEDVED